MTRVLLVPLSDFPDDSFRCYHDHIQRHCETDLRLLPAAEAAGNGSMFAHGFVRVSCSHLQMYF